MVSCGLRNPLSAGWRMVLLLFRSPTSSNRKLVKADKRAFFKAQPAQVNGLALLFGSIFSREIALSD